SPSMGPFLSATSASTFTSATSVRKTVSCEESWADKAATASTANSARARSIFSSYSCYAGLMIVADLSEIGGRTYPARCRPQNLVGGASPIQASNFSMGNVTLEPNGGQVPWHNQEQEEIYFIVEGTAEMCLGEERRTVTGGQAIYIPPRIFHQLTNIGDTPC